MSDPDFALRLVELEAVLGQTIGLADRPAEPDQEDQDTSTLATRTNQSAEFARESAMVREQETLRRRAAEMEEEAREKEELAERHRQAFDCSTFRPGEPVDKDFTFCPWKVVKNYPEAYIGKANRPRVCVLEQRQYQPC